MESRVTIKFKNLFEGANIAHTLVLEDISFTYDTKQCTFGFSCSNKEWLFSTLVNLDLRDLEYVKVNGVKYNYMGLELNN